MAFPENESQPSPRKQFMGVRRKVGGGQDAMSLPQMNAMLAQYGITATAGAGGWTNFSGPQGSFQMTGAMHEGAVQGVYGDGGNNPMGQWLQSQGIDPATQRKLQRPMAAFGSFQRQAFDRGLDPNTATPADLQANVRQGNAGYKPQNNVTYSRNAAGGWDANSPTQQQQPPAPQPPLPPPPAPTVGPSGGSPVLSPFSPPAEDPFAVQDAAAGGQAGPGGQPGGPAGSGPVLSPGGPAGGGPVLSPQGGGAPTGSGSGGPVLSPFGATPMPPSAKDALKVSGGGSPPIYPGPTPTRQKADGGSPPFYPGPTGQDPTATSTQLGMDAQKQAGLKKRPQSPFGLGGSQSPFVVGQ